MSPNQRNQFVAFMGMLILMFTNQAQSAEHITQTLRRQRMLYASPAPVYQGSTTNFAILAGTGVTNDGKSNVKGDIGTYPGTTASGFPPGELTGSFYLSDVEGKAHAAQQSLTAAKADASSRAADQTIGVDMGGLTLPPGVYYSAGTMLVTGTLTLDAGGDDNACWIFNMGSTLTISTYSKVKLVGGSGRTDVFWNVGSSAEIKTGSTLVGTVMAATGIAVGTGASTGPLLASAGEVTLIDNDVTAYSYNEPDTLTGGEIAGIVIGAVVFLLLVGLLIFFCCYGWAALVALLTCQSCRKPSSETKFDAVATK